MSSVTFMMPSLDSFFYGHGGVAPCGTSGRISDSNSSFLPLLLHDSAVGNDTLGWTTLWGKGFKRTDDTLYGSIELVVVFLLVYG